MKSKKLPKRTRKKVAHRSLLKSFCIWCGQHHASKAPARCVDLGEKFRAACKEAEPWLVMMALERKGTAALDNWNETKSELLTLMKKVR